MFVLAIWELSTLLQYWGVTIVWGLLGIALLVTGFKLFDWATPKISFNETLNKGNMAVAVVIAGFLVATAIVIHAAVSIQ
jgi:putative membrane protein